MHVFILIACTIVLPTGRLGIIFDNFVPWCGSTVGISIGEDPSFAHGDNFAYGKVGLKSSRAAALFDDGVSEFSISGVSLM